MPNTIKKQLEKLKSSNGREFIKAEKVYAAGGCQILALTKQGWDVLISEFNHEDIEIKIRKSGENHLYLIKNKSVEWDYRGMAALMQIREELEKTGPGNIQTEGKAYTREGMMKRVLDERRDKALKAKYRIVFADNIYGEHVLTNEKGVKYKITLRDFKNETGYIDNPDLRTNKLGTTKHIMFAFNALKSRRKTFDKLSRQYPFVEIYLNPLNNYRISWFYPHPLPPSIAILIRKYFGNKSYIEEEKTKDFLLFIRDAVKFPSIKIRPEVEEKVQKSWEEEMLETVAKDEGLDFSLLKTKLFPYQQEGVRFAVFRTNAIIADEMGLGKTIQAIAAAVIKKKLFGFEKCLIICPASLKEQWKREIDKFSFETGAIVEGLPFERKKIYRENNSYFIIANYETVLRDSLEMNRMEPDFIILDEAQRIKNFSTATAQSIKRLEKKHSLVITGTPIENKLIDLYSIMQFVDPEFLAPLWEFSYQHCYFDEIKKDKITGYFNLQQLNEQLKSVLLRREKRKVLRELPKVTEVTAPVMMHPDQRNYHASFAQGVSKILHKKYISPYDMQRLMMLLNNMRMVCDSTFLIDKETCFSPKLEELKHILLEKLDVKNNQRKVIIFSEWITMLNLIGKLLHDSGIGYAQLSGNVAVKNRGKLVKKFETDPLCKIFLSTESGGSGLNLQMADTVINFELPWNPAKKNQRLGRIDRLGQRSKQLTVINLITKDSFEMKIASGLSLKQNLFDGVLKEGGMDVVDFSSSGKAQFLKELEAMMEELSQPEKVGVVDETNVEMIDEEETLEKVIAEESGIESKGREQVRIHNSREAPLLQTEMMENVLNHGMEFLSGLLKMTTGQSIGLENKKVEIDKENGEVVMRFKLPNTITGS